MLGDAGPASEPESPESAADVVATGSLGVGADSGGLLQPAARPPRSKTATPKIPCTFVVNMDDPRTHA
jgi:hypothetical protein